MSEKTIRIGGASGFWGDAARATPQLLATPDLDYIVYDYLAENTEENTYCEALVSDKQKWQDAVDARLEGRARNRRSKVDQSDATIDASSSPM